MLTEEHPSLPHSVEAKDQSFSYLAMMLTAQQPIPRLWFLTPFADMGQTLIQVQPDRFLQNWRRKDLNSEDYPSYDTNRTDFQRLYAKFVKFLRSEKLEEPEPDQCEITYVNRIHATVENPLGPLKFSLAPGFTHINGDPDNVSFTCSYWIEELKGRIVISAQTAKLQNTREKFIDFRIQARGAPTLKGSDGLMDWLDKGHYYVVTTFEQLTSDEAHREWGIKP